MLQKQFSKFLKLIRCLINHVYTYTKNTPLKVFLATDYASPRLIDIFVVAFNDIDLIKYQYSFMQKNLQPDEYHYIICDNSNNKEIANQIFEFCHLHNITYYRLPKFLYIGPSYSHGYALNWIYRHIINLRKNNFAFIDHDIFPINPINLSKYLQTPLCGAVRERHGCWYPWAAFSFYNYDFMKNKKVNFLPCRYKHIKLDTGGGNYKYIYKNLDKNLWQCLSEHYIDIHSGKDFIYNQKLYKEQDDFVYHNVIEIIDTKWLHIIGGSQWGGEHNKLDLALKYMSEIESKTTLIK